MKQPLKIYVAGPINGINVLATLANIEAGLKASADLMVKGYAPFPVFSDFQIVMRCPQIRIEQIYAYSIAWMEHADAVLMLDGWQLSRGAQAERQHAAHLEIPIFYCMTDLDGWREEKERVEQILARSDD